MTLYELMLKADADYLAHLIRCYDTTRDAAKHYTKPRHDDPDCQAAADAFAAACKAWILG